MRYYKIKKNKFIKLTIVLLVLEILFFFLGFKKGHNIKYSYQEDNSVDYNVFLKENNYFDKPFLEKNNTYITSLIDYIDATFSYKVNFNKKVSGSINYKLVAEIKADKANNETGTYWTKEYTLTPVQKSELLSTTSHSIELSENIDYNQYNDLLNNFIDDYKLQADSTLKIALIVNGTATIDNTKETMDIDSEVSLTMPLSKLAIEGKIETSNSNIEREIIANQESTPMQVFFKILFFVGILIYCYYLKEYVKVVKSQNKSLTPQSRIRKINNEYDGIITKVKDAKFTKFVRIDVESFEDLVNVYDNIREPVNFYSDSEKAIYFIINNNSCYVYTINK